MKKYIISLPEASERRCHIMKEFSRVNIDFTFFDALSPSARLEQNIQAHLPNLAQSSLSQGERACFMSHLVLWQYCLDENLPYICIFEDDVLLGQNAAEFLNNTDWLFERFPPTSQFILRLETFLMPVTTSLTSINTYHGYHFMKLNSIHYGTAGYIISQHTAKILLDEIKTVAAEKLQPIDIMLFEYFIHNRTFNVYQLSPAICIQELQLHQSKSKLFSQLEQERKARQQAERPTKKTFKQKLCHIFTKPHRIRQKWLQKKESLLTKQIIPFE